VFLLSVLYHVMHGSSVSKICFVPVVPYGVAVGVCRVCVGAEPLSLRRVGCAVWCTSVILIFATEVQVARGPLGGSPR
jgi:hypothetical protein